MINTGLRKAVADIPPLEFELKSGQRIKFKFSNAYFFKPQITDPLTSASSKLYPKECRMRGSSYKGRLTVQINWWIDGQPQPQLEKNLGDIPMMVLKLLFSSKIQLKPVSSRSGLKDAVWLV